MGGLKNVLAIAALGAALMTTTTQAQSKRTALGLKAPGIGFSKEAANELANMEVIIRQNRISNGLSP